MGLAPKQPGGPTQGEGGWAGRQKPRKVSQSLGGHQPRDVNNGPNSVELWSLCSGTESPYLMCGFSLATKSRDSSSLGGVE